mgnify:CR=1 FL=1
MNIYKIQRNVKNAYGAGYFDEKDIDDACDELAEILGVKWEVVYFCAKSLIVYANDALFDHVEEEVRERFYDGDDDGPFEVEFDDHIYGREVVFAFLAAFEEDE